MHAEMQNGAAPFDSLESRAARDRSRRRAQARSCRWGPGSRRQGWEPSEVSECVQRCLFAVP